MPDIKAIQTELRASKIDGWLFYDHHHRDPIAEHVLGLDADGLSTRRWFYFIPSRGEPRKLVHRIEQGALDSLAGRKQVYSGWEELHKALGKLLSGSRKIAMQYSPDNDIPYIGLVDAGTVELVRKLKKKVVTSADLVQTFEAAWTPEQLDSHLEAGKIVDRITQSAFERVAAFVRDSQPITEFELQQWILEQFRANGLTTAEPPMAAVQPNNGNPHYEPKQGASRPIRAGDLLLLDIWAKLDRLGSVYYDITWVGYLGARVPDAYAKIFRIVREARDRADRIRGRIGRGGARRFTAGKWIASRAKRSARQATPNISFIAPATASARKFTATAPTWTDSRRATTAKSCRTRAFRSSRGFICPSSASAAKSTFTSASARHASPAPSSKKFWRCSPERWIPRLLPRKHVQQ